MRAAGRETLPPRDADRRLGGFSTAFPPPGVAEARLSNTSPKLSIAETLEDTSDSQTQNSTTRLSLDTAWLRARAHSLPVSLFISSAYLVLDQRLLPGVRRREAQQCWAQLRQKLTVSKDVREVLSGQRLPGAH